MLQAAIRLSLVESTPPPSAVRDSGCWAELAREVTPNQLPPNRDAWYPKREGLPLPPRSEAALSRRKPDHQLGCSHFRILHGNPFWRHDETCEKML